MENAISAGLASKIEKAIAPYSCYVCLCGLVAFRMDKCDGTSHLFIPEFPILSNGKYPSDLSRVIYTSPYRLPFML